MKARPPVVPRATASTQALVGSLAVAARWRGLPDDLQESVEATIYTPQVNVGNNTSLHARKMVRPAGERRPASAR